MIRPAGNCVVRHGVAMRDSFITKGYEIAHWFPGHMGKGMNQLYKRLTDVDCVVEVHDARIPISGRNPLFEKEISVVKPHLLMLNKVDLIDYDGILNITEYYKEKNKDVIFANCKDPKGKGVRDIVPKVVDLVKCSERYQRSTAKDYSIMIIGIPNVGKSSLINALRVRYMRKGHATPVGAKPGITKSVLERIKICEDPLVYVLDTPGILAPKIGSIEIGLKIALVNTIKDNLVGEAIIADYLLYRLNFEGNHKYVDALQLNEPSDDIQKVLAYYAVKNNMIQKMKNYSSGGYIDVPSTNLAAKNFLQFYRTGQLGILRLDI